MSKIKVLGHVTIYDNPIPNLVSRHGYFPGIVKLPNEELLTLFAMGEAFESLMMTICVSRSCDNGKTWTLEGPMYENLKIGPVSFKPTVLSDGTLIAIGYGFCRDNPEIFVNPETGGLPDGANYVSFSQDNGHSWSHPQKITHSHPEILEISGPCIELKNGDIIASGPPFPMWDKTRPSGLQGFILRSRDKGKTWDNKTVYYKNGNISPYECRQCEMQTGRVVMIIWCLDEVANKNLTNHVVVSKDNGMTFSEPIDTGVSGQASNLMYLGDNQLLVIHCFREGDVGLYVHLVDFKNDEWNIVSKTKIWGNAPSKQIGRLADMGKSLKFGQPTLLQLDNGEILAIHWAIEDGQGRILSHRLQLI